MFQLILSGLALGCVYSLVALGYHITFMTSRTLNFAQGSAMMLGAVTALILVVDFGWPTPLAMMAAILLLGIFGLALERLAVRPFVLRGSMAWVMSTLAVGIIVENVVLLVFGKSPRGLPNALAQDPVTIAGAGHLSPRAADPGGRAGRGPRSAPLLRRDDAGAGAARHGLRPRGLACGRHRRQPDGRPLLRAEQHAGSRRRRADRPADRRQQQHGLPDRPQGVCGRHRRRPRTSGRHPDREPRLRRAWRI